MNAKLFRHVINHSYCSARQESCMTVLELRAKALEEAISGLKLMIDARLSGMDRALKVETTEMERRLSGLNELRGDVIKDRDQYVRKDIYDQTVSTINRWHDEYTRSHLEIANRITALETRALVWGTVIVFFFLLVQVAVHLWPR